MSPLLPSQRFLQRLTRLIFPHKPICSMVKVGKCHHLTNETRRCSAQFQSPRASRELPALSSDDIGPLCRTHRSTDLHSARINLADSHSAVGTNPALCKGPALSRERRRGNGEVRWLSVIDTMRSSRSMPPALMPVLCRHSKFHGAVSVDSRNFGGVSSAGERGQTH